MPKLPYLPEGNLTRQVLATFSGYNHNHKIPEGEFYDMENLSSDHFPMLSTRPCRAVARHLSVFQGILGKSALCYVDGGRLYYGGLELTSYFTSKGLAISPVGEKQLVSMGSYLLIFPDKLYLNTANFFDCGAMEAEAVTSGEVEYRICTADGTAYGVPTVSSAQPNTKENGALWLDTSGKLHVLRQYSKATDQWTEIPTVYTKISAPGIGAPFRQYDGVTISGCAGNPQVKALNGSTLIQEKGADYIVVAGLLDQSFLQTTGAVTVKRAVPDLDFVCQCGNRIWGCKYGQVGGRTVNEICCCALGDFRNWSKYQGLSTDSYTASVGTDGPWTGAVNYLGNPIFFKEQCLHKVYVSAAGAHQIVDTALPGVQIGSHKSLSLVGRQLYYLSRDGVCAYDGSLPVNVSQKLGGVYYANGVAGTLGSKYYISMEDGQGKASLFCLDTGKGIWCREDGVKALGFAAMPGDLYMAAADALYSLTGREGESEARIPWMAQSGLIGYEDVNQKYVSRVDLRMMLPPGSTAKLLIRYDSTGDWYSAGTVTGRGTGSFLLPLRPRRCDHFSLKLMGTGEMKLYSIARLYESGSDGGVL